MLGTCSTCIPLFVFGQQALHPFVAPYPGLGSFWDNFFVHAFCRSFSCAVLSARANGLLIYKPQKYLCLFPGLIPPVQVYRNHVVHTNHPSRQDQDRIQNQRVSLLSPLCYSCICFKSFLSALLFYSFFVIFYHDQIPRMPLCLFFLLQSAVYTLSVRTSLPPVDCYSALHPVWQL